MVNESRLELRKDIVFQTTHIGGFWTPDTDSKKGIITCHKVLM